MPCCRTGGQYEQEAWAPLAGMRPAASAAKPPTARFPIHVYRTGGGVVNLKTAALLIVANVLLSARVVLA